MQRRTFLTAAGTSAALVAGCTDIGDETDPEEDEEQDDEDGQGQDDDGGGYGY